MPDLQVMAFYQRHLPHWQPKQAEFFITFRLAGSLPKQAVTRLQFYRKQELDNDQENQNQIQRNVFKKYEALLDRPETGPTWLGEEKVAQIVQNAFHYYDKESYDLYAFTIMPNHVHLVFQLLNASRNGEYPVTDILQSIKSYTALECNKVLGREGAFWQSESYDRVIRDQNELEKTIHYTLNNPVNAGLIDHWQEWTFNYCKPEFKESFL